MKIILERQLMEAPGSLKLASFAYFAAAVGSAVTRGISCQPSAAAMAVRSSNTITLVSVWLQSGKAQEGGRGIFYRKLNSD
jgi:hypothetical protein